MVFEMITERTTTGSRILGTTRIFWHWKMTGSGPVPLLRVGTGDRSSSLTGSRTSGNQWEPVL